MGAQHIAKPFTLHAINKRIKGLSSHPTPEHASESFQVSIKLYLNVGTNSPQVLSRDHILTPCHLGIFKIRVIADNHKQNWKHKIKYKLINAWFCLKEQHIIKWDKEKRRQRVNTHWVINKLGHVRKHNNVGGLKMQTRKLVLSNCIV